MAAPGEQPQPTEAPRRSLTPVPSRHSIVDGNMSPRTTTPKVVSIAEPETFDLDKTAKQFRASVSGRRLSGRPSLERLSSAKSQSLIGNPSISSLLSDDSDPNASQHGGHTHESLLRQVRAWMHHEKTRRVARKAKRKARKDAPVNTDPKEHTHGEIDQSFTLRERRESDSSEGSVALEQLANILEKTMSLKSTEGSIKKRRPSHGQKLSSIMKRHSTVSSDTDYFEGGDLFVPSCDAILDNSKTMAYGAGGPESEGADPTAKLSRKSRKEKEAWSTFKYEILRLVHTLKLKGWRRVSLEQSNEIEVQRLSGALTNAVYVVSPPKHVSSEGEQGNAVPAPKNPSPKLLLRIYGPQVEHLIDREGELQILQRLARKRIGPRMLGTFTNGRFEEFFNANPLSPNELRMPDTSKQIAKRMRELHEGIELLQKEREGGPFVWLNWDKWVHRCEKIVTWLDQQIIDGNQGSVQSPADEWKNRGLVCGVQWSAFRKTVEKYRLWLEEQYGGIQRVNERLVFAHNDTQYGNILRLMPAGESPLLLPANEHKQLIVIDFEYANANLPGLEFANHFTEWCYNYHDDVSYRCNTAFYPTPEAQHRFIHAYLTHNPTYKARGGSASNPPTPYLSPLPTSGSTTALAATAAPSNISAFMLDSRAPPSEKNYFQEQEAQAERETTEEAHRLMAETKLWRLANSAQWVAWGIVQAHVPGIPDFHFDDSDDGEQGGEASGMGEHAQQLESATKEIRDVAGADKKSEAGSSEAGADVHGKQDSPAQEEEEKEFDYLGYAQERALFFWGDAIRMGIIKAEDLPESVRQKVKIVDY
ncbi:kinase-like domain-containing protein [Massariosphaeria phaeospora]|uniref:Kinase-like domain-containing protein n=1 Tax=Massariosphaeria phaeospora TaxID=100035 RepID=A0A7C8MII8_9PLEO|nr:kinase-like domain-containing protein [Massariosphaeria phaeospora]